MNIDPVDRSGIISEAAAEELRAEIERLVQIVARKPSLSLHEGKPGCGWAFNWDHGTVVVDPDDIRFLAGDLCRGLALHEAAHARISVLHQFLPRATLGKFVPVLNAVEDLRIDTWSASRFPGGAPWLAAHNRVVHEMIRQRGLPRSRQTQFLLGILERGYFGCIAEGTLPEVVAGLNACRKAIEQAVACQPPPGDDPMGILSSQRQMWLIVRDRVLPTWNLLVRQDNADGIGSLAQSELEALMGDIGAEWAHRSRSGGHGIPRGPLRRRLPQAPRSTPPGVPAAGSGNRQPRGGTTNEASDHVDRYEAAWKRVAPLADRLGDELLRVLLPKQRLRWSEGHRSGPRLLIRRAMQFDADPRNDALFSRAILPQRRTPAVLLLVDRSGSMTTNRLIDRALEGTVLLIEVCNRIGVPAAVWSFANGLEEELAWDDPLDSAAHRRIGSLPGRCDGTTDMATALAATGQAFADRHGDPKLLFVIGDGAPDDRDTTLATANRLEQEGLITVGLGLGPGTAPLATYFQRSVVEITPETLVDRLAGLLGESLLAST